MVETATNATGKSRVILARFGHRSGGRGRDSCVFLDRLDLVWQLPGRVSGDVLIFRHVTHPRPIRRFRRTVDTRSAHFVIIVRFAFCLHKAKRPPGRAACIYSIDLH